MGRAEDSGPGQRAALQRSPTHFKTLSPVGRDSSTKMGCAQAPGARERIADVTIICTIYIQMFI